jgi:hypothetical protein
MSVNRIDATLTDDQRDQANAARAALPDVLPFLIAIDRADRPKFGDKNRPIDVKPLASPRRIPTCCRAVSTSRNSAPMSNTPKPSTGRSAPLCPRVEL